LLRDSTGTHFRYLDNINTPGKETLADDLLAAIKKATPGLKKAEAEGRLAWAKYKDTRLTHLIRQNALSDLHLPVGGGTHVINASRADHGPSWRMVVSLTPQTEAWGVYPGGQSGNPGSKYYDSFADSWAKGTYYKLWIMKKEEAADKRVKFKITMTK
jgi:penicillin amidase